MNMSVAPPGFTSQVSLCRLTCDLGSHSWTHPGETLHSFYGLHLCDAAVHKQFRPGDVAAVLGSEKNDRPGDFIGRAKPAERNAGENRLQTLSARSCGRQRVIESGGVGEARAHRVHADAALLQVRRPDPREATYGGLADAGNGTRPQPLAGADGGVQDDRGTLRQQRQRLLHREKQTFHVDVEDRVVELLGDRAQGRKLRNTGIGEDNVEPALLALDLGNQAIEIVKVRHISSDGGDVAPDLLDRRRQLGLTPARDEHVGAFVHELLRRREANAAIAASYECNFSFELTHVFLLSCYLFAIASAFCDEAQAPTVEMAVTPPSIRKSA